MITSITALREMRQEMYGQAVGAVSHAFGVEITKEADGVTLRAAVLTGSGPQPTTVVVERKLLDVTDETLAEAIQKILAEALFAPYLKMLQPPIAQPGKTMPWTHPIAPPWTNPIVPGQPGEFPQWPHGQPISPGNPFYPNPWITPSSPLNPGPTYIGDLPFPPNQITCLGGTTPPDTTGMIQMNDPNGDPT